MEKRNRYLAEEVQTLIAAKKKRKRRKGTGQMQKDCANCHTRTTPEWRRGPSGNRDLCNSCGLRWAKQVSSHTFHIFYPYTNLSMRILADSGVCHSKVVYHRELLLQPATRAGKAYPHDTCRATKRFCLTSSPRLARCRPSRQHLRFLANGLPNSVALAICTWRKLLVMRLLHHKALFLHRRSMRLSNRPTSDVQTVFFLFSW